MKANVCLFVCLFISFLTVTSLLHIFLWYFLTCDTREIVPTNIRTTTADIRPQTTNTEIEAQSDRETESDQSDVSKIQFYQEMADLINEQDFPWKAKVYQKLEVNIKQPMGKYRDIANSIKVWTEPKFIDDSVEYLKHLDSRTVVIPEHFDARTKWPLCSSLHNIKNQGSCGSCWAESAASVIADRLCVASNGSVDVEVSSQDLIECCANCHGCQGSLTQLHAYNHWIQHGIVTGGRHMSNEGCKPFKFGSECGTPCTMTEYFDNPQKGRNSSCVRKCRSGYPKTYNQDKLYGSGVYFIGFTYTINQFGQWLPVLNNNFNLDENWTSFRETLDSEVLNRSFSSFNSSFETVQLRVQKELIVNGPISVCFKTPQTFLIYGSGIYSPVVNDTKIYGHCVKVIGWGVEKFEHPVRLSDNNWASEVPYWLIANSWGKDWGEKGLVKMLRNSEAFQDLYDDIVVALPKL